ncbi:MAG TPA: hypothetical protein VGB99_04225 [Acidobacteriota bacterium]
MAQPLHVFCPVESGRPLAELAGALVARLARAFAIRLYRGRHEPDAMDWARAFPLRHATAYLEDRRREGDAPRLFLLEDDAYTCEALIPPLLRFGGAVYFLDRSFNRLYQTTTIYRGEPDAFIEKMRLVHGRAGERVARETVAGRGRDAWFTEFDLIPPLARAAALAWTTTQAHRTRLAVLGRSAACLPVPVPADRPAASSRRDGLLVFESGVDADLTDFLSAGADPFRWGRLEVIAPAWRLDAVGAIVERRAAAAAVVEKPSAPPAEWAAVADLRPDPGLGQHLDRHRTLMGGGLLALLEGPDTAHLPDAALLRAPTAAELGGALQRVTPEQVGQRRRSARSFAESELTYDRVAAALEGELLRCRDRLDAASRRWERFAEREERLWRRRILRWTRSRLITQGWAGEAVELAARELLPPGFFGR